eukprot:1906879-Lingulodinium_polyedra.AAC.1
MRSITSGGAPRATAVEAYAKSMTAVQQTATAQPTKSTSEGSTLYSDTPEHGDVPKCKFWQP